MKDTRRFVSCLLLSASAASFFPHRTVAQDQPDQDQICEVRKVGDCEVTAPKPLYHPDPEYTDRARKKKISGMVLLSIVVTPEGTVRDTKVTTSLDEDLDRQALKAVSTWKFQPATKDGKPVPVRITVETDFRIRYLVERRTPPPPRERSERRKMAAPHENLGGCFVRESEKSKISRFNRFSPNRSLASSLVTERSGIPMLPKEPGKAVRRVRA